MRWSDPELRRAAVHGRLLAWLCVVVFALQWACAPHDHHDAAKARHCVSCTLHAQPHAGPPQAAVPVAPCRWHVAYWSAAPHGADPDVAAAQYLMPPAQAPPRFP